MQEIHAMSELETIYAISRIVSETESIDDSLDEVTKYSRPVFIFDNLVVYLLDEDGSVNPVFARAIGRGRFLEEELAWGESVAKEVCEINKTIIRVEDLEEIVKDRTGNRHYLGLPVKFGDQLIGSLIFIRFGGPPFIPEQVNFPEFISDQVAQIIQRYRLVEKISDLEARRRLDNLQEEFIATISHELLTPLGYIKGYATTLLRHDIEWKNQKRREFLTIINEEADRLKELIDRLMDSSRLQAGTLEMKFQPVDLHSLIEDIVLKTKSQHDQLEIQTIVKTNQLQVQADPTRLSQLINNIINNALKYAPQSNITIFLEEMGENVSIAVRDNGSGIEPEYLDQIFHRFFRVPGEETPP